MSPIIRFCLKAALGSAVLAGAVAVWVWMARPDAARTAPPQFNKERVRAGLPHHVQRLISERDPVDIAERENRDLAAQEAEAVWGFWALVTSLGGLAATIVGAILLGFQIVLTRRALTETALATTAMKHANAIARAGQRPWLQIESAEVFLMTVPIGEVAPPGGKLPAIVHVTLTVRNSGPSPALNVNFTSKVVTKQKFNNEDQAAYFSECRSRRWQPLGNIAPGGTSTVRFSQMGDVDVQPGSDRILPALAISIGYESPDNDALHQTAQTFAVCRRVLQNGVLEMFPLAELQTVPKTAFSSGFGSPSGHVCQLDAVSGAVMV